MPRCAYDLLVIDLDGTLLDRRGEVSVRNRQAIDAARQAGVEVVIGTGRAWIESRHVLQAIGHEGMVIAAGGSVLCDATTGRTIDRRVMSQEVVEHITTELLADGHKALILKDSHATGYDYLAVGNGEFDPASTWWFDRLPIQVRHAAALVDDEHPADSVRIGAVASGSRLAPLAESLKESLAGRCSIQHWSAVTASHATGSDTHLIEAFCHDVNKWTMVQSYCKRAGIDESRVAAIGDGLNDVELVAQAKLGIAMANAGPQVMAVADRVTASHDDDGVALAIDRMLAGSW